MSTGGIGGGERKSRQEIEFLGKFLFFSLLAMNYRANFQTSVVSDQTKGWETTMETKNERKYHKEAFS